MKSDVKNLDFWPAVAKGFRSGPAENMSLVGKKNLWFLEVEADRSYLVWSVNSSVEIVRFNLVNS